MQHEPLEERALLSLWSLQDAGPMAASSALVDDALEMPEEVDDELQGLAFASPPPAGSLPLNAGLNDSSEFMQGDVWVTVVLLESDGTTDTNSEDWTATEITEVKSEIQEGLTWWEDTLTTQFPTSSHDLTFHIDFTYADTPVDTPYEPITHLSTQETFWIDSFLDSVGYNTAASYRTDLAQWNNDQRFANNAHWAFSIFVVDSSADADGRFTDASGMFAYAYPGGPHLTMTYDNANWGIDDMGQVLAHETGHIFYALDEYPGTKTYTSTSGYYNAQNLNAATGNPDPSTRVDSIMAEASLQNPAYLNHTSSPSSLAMIGWQDSDGDGIFDLLDVPLVLTGSGSFNLVTSEYEFTGNSNVATLTNMNPSGSSLDFTTNTVDRIQYRLDGGAWTDGSAYSSYSTPVAVNVPAGAGMHSIEIRTLFEETGLSSNVFTDTFGIGIDFGDAPAPYPTLDIIGGASHTISNGLFLGTTVDDEVDGQPDAGALGDDQDAQGDDEDGVVFLSTLNQGGLAVVQVTASKPGLLDAWVDFGNNGIWDVSDRVFNNEPLVAGVNTLNFNVPIDATITAETFARFRVSTAGATSPLGLLPDGEVEDYAVAIAGADINPTVRASDPGGNGMNNGQADEFRLIRNGTNIDVYLTDGGTPVFSRSFEYTSINTLTVEGSGDEDSLTLDFSGGDVIPIGGLSFDGTLLGGDSDLLTLEGGTFDTITHNLIGPNDGTIVLSGIPGVIAYTGLEPIVDNLVGTTRILNLPDNDEPNARLSDPDTTDSRVLFEAPGNIESVGINTVGMTNLVVNLGMGNDTLAIERLESGFGAAIEVDGGAGADSIHVLGDPGGVIARTIYQVGVTADAGNYAIDPDGTPANGDEMVLDFSGLESIDDTSLAVAYNIFLTDTADQAQLIDGPLVDAFVTSRLTNSTGASFTPVNFANKTNVTINGLDGADELVLDNPNAANGLTNLDLYGNELTDGGLEDDDDASDLFVAVQTSVAIRAFGQGGDDSLYHSIDEGADLSGLLGPIDFIGGPGTGDSILLQDINSAVAKTVALTDVALIGAAPGGITYSATESFRFESSSVDDTIDITSTNGNTQYLISGNAGSDTFTIGNTRANLGTFGGTLDRVLGPITISPDYGIPDGKDTLNVDDSNTASLFGEASITRLPGNTTVTLPGDGTFTAPATRLEGFAPATIDYFHADYFAATLPTSLAYLNVFGSTGDDVIVVNDSTATDTTTLDALMGDDLITVRGDGLSAANVFQGNAGDDRFVLDVTSDMGVNALSPFTSVLIEGNTHVAGSAFDQHDRLEINDLSAGTARNLEWQYGAASGDGSLADGQLTGFALPIDVETMETITYAGDGANNDSIDVNTPAVGTHQLSFAPTGPNSARVFLGGDPWEGPSADYYASLPGVAGGSLGPDLRVSGIQTSGGTFFSGGLNDQLIVYAPGELNLEDDGNVVVPGAGELGLTSAYDEIDVTEDRVRILNNGVELLRANVTENSFSQEYDTTDGLIVNAGFEAIFATNTADQITAAFSYDDGLGGFPIRINGGDPIPTFAPDGDHLEVMAEGEINVFSNRSDPPVVSITSTNASGDLAFPLRFSSIEGVALTPGNNSQTINLYGDNNDSSSDQDDSYLIVGTDIDSTLGLIPDAPGPFQPDVDGNNEFTLEINGSAKIGFRNVTQINAFGDERPSVGDGINDIDTLEITPYTDGTPQGWGIDVSFDAGNPVPDTAGAQDVLIVQGVAGVSEAFEIIPSGSGAGQVAVNNASSDTPISVIDYISTTNIEINGNDGLAGDTDTLTLFGTDVDDQVTANLAAVSGSMIEVTNGTGVLYTIDPPLTFATLDFMLGDGDDLVKFTPTDGIQAYFDGGAPLGGIHSAGDIFDLIPGVLDSTYLPGPTPDSGTFLFDPAMPADSVRFEYFEDIRVNSVPITPILPDAFEPNDLDTNATLLGSVPKTTLRNLTLHEVNPGVIDEDFFQITATDTGMLQIHCFVTPGGGDVNIELFDAAGNAIPESTSSIDNHWIAIPVVSQERYYLHVSSADALAARYELEIENFMAPTPTSVFLNSGHDTGRNNLDNVTSIEQPQLLIQAWLSNFAEAGIPILDATGLANNDPGAAIEVFINGVSVGYADPLGPTNELFTFAVPETLPTQTPHLKTGVPVGFGGGASQDAFGYMNLVSASVHIFDGQDTQIDAHADLSDALMVTYDPNLPVSTQLPTAPALLESSDSGVLGDGITQIHQPTFVGEAEVNALVRAYVDGQFVGESVVGSDATNGTLDDGLGAWEVTGVALADGDYDVTIELEDLAGNLRALTTAAETLSLTIDTLTPQRPTLDLVNSDDTGSSDQDNVTFGDLNLSRPAGDGILDFIVTADVATDPDTHTLVVKDGSRLIGTFDFDTLDLADGSIDGSGRLRINFIANATAFGVSAQGTHLLSLELIDTAGNRSDQSEELAVTVDFTAPDQSPLIVLAGFSDSGIIGDRLTNVNPPTFIGLGEPNAMVRVYANDTLVGEGTVGSDETDGIQGNHRGRWEVTVAPMAGGDYRITAELEDLAGNVTNRAFSPILDMTLDLSQPQRPSIDLVGSSDSGLYNDDDVTNIDAPTFTGTGEANSLIRIYAKSWDTMIRQLVGEGRVGSNETDPVDRMGVWQIAIVSLDEGVYDVTTELEDPSGNLSDPSDTLVVEIDTLQPNTPFLDLLAQDDTGRSDNDNITQVRNPLFSATTEDPNADLHRNEENFIFRIFDRHEELRYDSLDVTPYTLLMEQQLILTLELMTDGIHNLKLEVEDRAGNISEDFLLDVWVDTSPYLGNELLDTGPDSGVSGFLSTLGDHITNDNIPDFFGTAEPGSLVSLAIDGTTQPSNTYSDADGNWYIASNQRLTDGQHEAVFTFEDPAGNQTLSDSVFFFIDTQGPKITNLTQGTVSSDGKYRIDGTTSLFEPKPAGGPDEMISSLVVSFSDAHERTAMFSYEAIFGGLALDEGNYQVVGDANGNIPILDVLEYSNDPGPGVTTAQYELVFHRAGADGIWNTNDDEGGPLPDDRFTLTVSDALADPAGNTLDGESGADAPFVGQDPPANTLPIFPTGDGQPGGPFAGRFTVDSRPELGNWGAGSVWVDTNGNFAFDSDNPDDSNRDITYPQGFAGDDVFAGNFAASGTAADGFDKLAAYGQVNGSFRWLIDVTNDGAPDQNVNDPSNINGLPIAGRFDTNENNGDEVGLVESTFNPARTIWHFDTNHNFKIDQNDDSLTSQLQGHAAVGDIDGDTYDDLVTWIDDTFYIDLANGSLRGWDGVADHSFSFGFIGLRERPLVHDMDGDGFDDLGLWVPDRSGLAPEEASEWYFLVSGGASVLERIEISGDTGKPIVEYRPTPFGDDFMAQFGDENTAPIVGNFDPPLADPVAFPPKQTVLLFGTDGDDVLQIQAGATPDAWTVELNGIVQELGAAGAIDFQSGSGHDIVTLIGTDADDAAEIFSDRAVLTSDAYEVSVSQVEQITIDGSGGENSLVMHDTVGDDRVVIRPGRITLDSPGVSILAERFDNVNVLADVGGHDTAKFYDSPGDDWMVISPQFGQMTGEGFMHRVQFFDNVSSYASAGGVDSAELHDSPGDDRVETSPTWSWIRCGDFDGRVKNFDSVSAFANAGGFDTAKMRDSYGDDTFVGRPNESTLSGEGFYTRVKSFDSVNAEARLGGFDTASMSGSSGNDRFFGRDRDSQMIGDGFSIRAKLFDDVIAVANQGGFDIARLIGSEGNDTLVAQADTMVLHGSQFLNRVESFDAVQVSGDHGNDTAEINDAVIEEETVAPIMARDAAWQVSWLNQFELLQQRNEPSEGGSQDINAVDQIFRAFWD